MDVGDEGPLFPPEAERLEDLCGDGDRELKRCRDCGTLYHGRHHYEYDAYAPSYDEYHLARVGDAATAAVAPLFEPLAPDALDAALARALCSDSAEVRTIAALVLQSAAEKGGDAALRAAADGLGAVESDVSLACYNALLAAFRHRGPARARAVHLVLAGLGEDVYGVRALRSLCQEEMNAGATHRASPTVLLLPESEELVGRSASDLEADLRRLTSTSRMPPSARRQLFENLESSTRLADAALRENARRTFLVSSIVAYRRPELQLKSGEGMPLMDLMRIALTMPLRAGSLVGAATPQRQEAIANLLNEYEQQTYAPEDRDFYRRLALAFFIKENAADPGILESGGSN